MFKFLFFLFHSLLFHSLPIFIFPLISPSFSFCFNLDLLDSFIFWLPLFLFYFYFIFFSFLAIYFLPCFIFPPSHLLFSFFLHLSVSSFVANVQKILSFPSYVFPFPLLLALSCFVCYTFRWRDGTLVCPPPPMLQTRVRIQTRDHSSNK